MKILQQLDTSLDNTNKVKEVEKEIEEWHTREEEFYRQKARDTLFHGEDQNTKHFHLRDDKRRVRNKIESLQKPNGNWCNGKSELENLLNFQGIMCTSEPVNDNDFLNLLPTYISDEDNVALEKIPDEAEIVQPLKSMKLWKTPRPDGFHLGFFQTQWSVIKDDVINMI